MSSISKRWLLLALVAFTFLPGLAHAGCQNDRDCKGARICVAEECVDSESEPSTRLDAGTDRDDLRFARTRRGGSMRAMGAGWTLLGFGTALGLGAVSTGLAGVYSPTPEALGGGSILFLGVGGPLASISGSAARRGLRRLGVRPTGPGLRIAGWITYGVAMAGGLGAVAAGLSGSGSLAAGIGAVPLLSGITSIVLFEVDGIRNRRRLVEAIDRADPRRRRVSMLVTPWGTTRDGGTGGVAVVGGF